MGSRTGLFALLTGAALGQLDAIPKTFDRDQWAWVSNEDPLLAVIPGTFNRTAFEASSAGNTSDPRITAMFVSFFNAHKSTLTLS